MQLADGIPRQTPRPEWPRTLGNASHATELSLPARLSYRGGDLIPCLGGFEPDWVESGNVIRFCSSGSEVSVLSVQDSTSGWRGLVRRVPRSLLWLRMVFCQHTASTFHPTMILPPYFSGLRPAKHGAARARFAAAPRLDRHAGAAPNPARTRAAISAGSRLPAQRAAPAPPARIEARAIPPRHQ